MNQETIERGQQLLDAKHRVEVEIKKVDEALEKQAMPITRMGFSYETNASYFIIRDRDFIRSVAEWWRLCLKKELAEINFNIMAL